MIVIGRFSIMPSWNDDEQTESNTRHKVKIPTTPRGAVPTRTILRKTEV
jgi:hypothetical protein